MADLSFKLYGNFNLESDSLVDSKNAARIIPNQARKRSMKTKTGGMTKVLSALREKIDKDLYPILKKNCKNLKPLNLLFFTKQ